ncbi:YoaK family protein [Streptomyces sp. NPDC053560]|uniref:YoaK family protein n=1 Tax=Streptomyces sp. NPDC053560 TaxID=3365711 RepID=UPI0037CE6EA2
MTTPEDARLKRFVVIAAAVLAAVAGFVNSVFLTSLLLPVSHVTGSLSQASMDVTGGDLSGLTNLATVLIAFFCGAIAAGALLGPHTQTIGRRYGVALLIEAALLGAAPLVAGEQQSTPYAMILAAGACGLQNGMFSNYRGMVLRTSHMTGTLTDLGVLLGCRGYRGGQAWKGVLLATTVVTFAGGGVAGAYAASAAALHALWIPATCCALLGGGYALYRHRRHVTRPRHWPARSPHGQPERRYAGVR